MAENTKCGMKVRDTISGLEGIILARTEWLYGCVRVTLQPTGSKDGKPFEPFTIDEPQLEVIAESEAKPFAGTHGDRPETTRRTEPGRAGI